MKKLPLLGLALLFLLSCNKEKQRYFAHSPEMNSMKASITEYANGDWDAWSTHFADTAKFYVNSNKGLNIDEFKKGQLDLLSNFSSYGFVEKNSWMEMVVDTTEETWVNYWATWRGTLKATNREIDVPVHISSRFIDGKVVRLENYWDSAPITTALSKIEKENNLPVDEKAMLAQIDTFINEFNNNKDISVLSNILTDDYLRYLNGTKVATGAKELATNINVFHTGFPDLEVTIPHRSVNGNNVFVHWFFTGTNTGEFAGSPATGKKVKVEGLSRFHFNKDGKIDEEDVFYDNLSVMEQLGHTLN
tara:strand:+ start:3903 stop:4817 length:915 start_codon:yes stop_codon:yes gene_type:complete